MTEITRMGVVYRQLENGTLTCGPLDQSGMVGGTGEQDRNDTHNPERLARIKEFHRSPKVLDYGCGTGLLVKYLRANGLNAWGYDKYYLSQTQNTVSEYVLGPNNILPGAFPKGFDVITMIEVIEHTAAPYEELEMILDCLKPGGVLMIETSFTDWMELYTDPYVNPTIGHSTIFSHKGLDEVMQAKGFEIYGHINRNVRVYNKPKSKVEDKKITLITMGQGNPVALKRTLDSFKGTVDEIIFGDLLIFDSDRAIIEKYKEEYNLQIIRMPFNFIFDHGFALTLNALAFHATNDWILYMNVSEVMDGDHPIKAQMSDEYNCYPLDHAVETHRWFRLYNRKELQWGGIIHEEVIGDLRQCPFFVMRFQDTEKDVEDSFKAKVCNDVKEINYWKQYMLLVEDPALRGTTHQGWIDHAKADYDHFKERMLKKGKRYEAFLTGNLTMYLEDIYTNPEFEKERFESTELINFQGNRMLLG